MEFLFSEQLTTNNFAMFVFVLGNFIIKDDFSLQYFQSLMFVNLSERQAP